jgi:hypothetical protein
METTPKLDGYVSLCYHSEKMILDNEYVARSKTKGTKYYHCFCAQSVNLVDNLKLRKAESPHQS